MKKIGIIFLVLVVLLALAFGGGYYYYNSSLKPVDIANIEEETVLIEEGSSGNSIAKTLKDNDLIKDENIFKLYIRLNNINNLKAGEYRLSKNMSVSEIISELEKGGKNINVSSFTIPEGFELKQIAEKLENEGFVDRDIFLEKTSNKNNYDGEFEFLKKLNDGQSLEGYLFASTYEVENGSSEDEIIKIMLNKFDEIYNENILPLENNTELNFNEIVTLASIIEREAVLNEERDIIAGIFYNRLKENMMLQSCATVQYILGERKEVLSNADTQIPSEYNTYINTGLPPTPISSMSVESLIAAVNPVETDYLYFRSKEDGTGGHIFSKTYEEHLQSDPSKN